MTGAIEYLQAVKKTCLKYNRDCKRCPLGNQENIQDTLCPSLLPPWQWRNEKFHMMVFKGDK